MHIYTGRPTDTPPFQSSLQGQCCPLLSCSLPQSLIHFLTLLLLLSAYVHKFQHILHSNFCRPFSSTFLPLSLNHAHVAIYSLPFHSFFLCYLLDSFIFVLFLKSAVDFCRYGKMRLYIFLKSFFFFIIHFCMFIFLYRIFWYFNLCSLETILSVCWICFWHFCFYVSETKTYPNPTQKRKKKSGYCYGFMKSMDSFRIPACDAVLCRIP